MSKYVLIYKANEAYDWSKLPEQEVKKVMDVWGEFLGSMGPALIDRGDAFKFGGKSLSKSGAKDADNLLTGFSIVEAEDLDEALEMAKNAPGVLSGQGTVEVYEAFGV